MAAATALAACGDATDDASFVDPLAPFRVAATIEVGAAPHGIRFDDAGDTAYVALSGDGEIAVVDLERERVVDRWEAGTTPLDLIRVGDGWLVSQFRDSVLLRLDEEGDLVPDAGIPLGAGPSLFTPVPIRGRAWIVSEFADALTEIDLTDGAVVGTYPTGDRPYPADVMFDGSYAFVPNLEDGTVSVIDLLNDETDATVEVCDEPPGGTLTPDHVTYLAACGGSGEVVFVNTASLTVTGRVGGFGARPFSAVVTADGRYAIVNDAGGSSVAILDVATRALVQTLEVGEQPIVVRLHPDGRRVLVANEVGGTLVVLEPAWPAGAAPEASGSAPDVAGEGGDPASRTEVVVMGMIHGDHVTSSRFGLATVADLVRAIEPDVWMVEIPPNRWERAEREFVATGRVDEPRVRRFPEYIDVLFPLSRELDFEVVPTAGWTEPMSDARAAWLAAAAQDPDLVAEWTRYELANAAADSAIRAGGEPDDPRWIHTDAYDAAYELRLSTYNELFNDSLGPGGWDNINRAHFANIARALDGIRGEGKRVLITYGAGHKGWFLRALRERDDVELLDLAPFLDARTGTATRGSAPDGGASEENGS